MRFERSIDIDAPQQRVWDVLTDIEAWPRRIETVESVGLLTPAPLAKGGRVRLKQPKLPEGVWDVTTWDEPSYFEWTQKTGGITNVAGHRVEALADGGAPDADPRHAGPPRPGLRPFLQEPHQPLHVPRGRGHEARVGSVMALKRLDNVAVIVDDLDAAIAFFTELGMELEGRTTLGGDLVDRLTGLDGTRSEIAMMRTPDGHGRLELSRYQHPAAVGPDPGSQPANTRGMSRAMFNVDDIDDVVERLQALGGELVGDIVRYEDAYRLCYLRGPEGIIIGLAEDVS